MFSITARCVVYFDIVFMFQETVDVFEYTTDFVMGMSHDQGQGHEQPHEGIGKAPIPNSMYWWWTGF